MGALKVWNAATGAWEYAGAPVNMEPAVPAGTASQFYRGDKLWVPTNGANLIQNPGFEDVGSGQQPTTPHWAPSNIAFGGSTIPRSGNAASHHQVTTATAANTDVFVANGPPTSLTSHPRCAMGESYRAEFWIRNGVSGTTQPTVRAFLKAVDNTGAVVQTVLGASFLVTTTYTLYSVEMTITAASAQYVIAGVNAPSALAVSTAWRIDDMALRYLPDVTATQRESLLQDTGWVDITSAITAGETGWTAVPTLARYRMLFGRWVELQLGRTTNASITQNSPNYSNMNITTGGLPGQGIPDNLRPTQPVFGNGRFGDGPATAVLNTDGTVVCSGGAVTGTWASGATNFSGDWSYFI